MIPMRVFIGYDAAETVALNVLAHSIVRRSSIPVSVTPLVRRQLHNVSRGVFTRKRDTLASTDFSDTRFLVPWLCGYTGLAVFMDCDQLMLSDIAELTTYATPGYAVSVRKRSHVPRERTKFLGSAQTTYLRKNWSSLVVFNCERCTRLTPEYVNTAPGLELHQFNWVDDDEIGNLPDTYNHLVGYDVHRHDVKHVHYTLGGPYFHDYKKCDYADVWFAEQRSMNDVQQRVILTERAVIG